MTTWQQIPHFDPEEQGAPLLLRGLARFSDLLLLFIVWRSLEGTFISQALDRWIREWSEPWDLIATPWVAASFVLLVFDLVTNATGRSPAKLVFRLRVVDTDGLTPGIGGGIARSSFTILVAVLFLVSLIILRDHYRWYNATHDDASLAGVWLFPVYMIVCGLWTLDPLTAFINSNLQALHDKLAGTFVFRA